MADELLKPEEMDNCVPTEAELLEYLSEPDDTVAEGLTLVEKRLVAKTILYGRNIAKAQLAKVQKARRDRPSLKKLLFELRDIGKEATEEYGFYEGSLLVLVEDLMPILKRLGIKKKEWKYG